MNRFLLVTAALTALTGCASASTFTINSLSVDPSPPYTTLNVRGPLYSDHPIAGLMTIGTTSGKSFEVFCVDLSGVIHIGSDNLTYLTSPTLPTNGFGTPVPTVTQRELQTLANLGLTAGANEPAIQGAIWGLEYPTETVTSGNPATEAAILNYETWAVAHPTSPTSFFLDSPVGAQNLIVASPAAIPNPPTWLMMLMGFAGLGFIGRRKTVCA